MAARAFEAHVKAFGFPEQACSTKVKNEASIQCRILEPLTHYSLVSSVLSFFVS